MRDNEAILTRINDHRTSVIKRRYSIGMQPGGAEFQSKSIYYVLPQQRAASFALK